MNGPTRATIVVGGTVRHPLCSARSGAVDEPPSGTIRCGWSTPTTSSASGPPVGSAAVALIAHGDCPVAVIHGAADASPPAEGPVVVGVDGSSTSDAATATAFDEASWRGAEL